MLKTPLKKLNFSVICFTEELKFISFLKKGIQIMSINKRIIGIILPALVLVHTHETIPLSSAVGTCARFAGKSLVAATIIGIFSLPLFIKKEDIKDTKTLNKKAFYEQLAKIILGGMGIAAAFDYFTRAKNEEAVLEEQTLIEDEGKLSKAINVSTSQSLGKELGAEARKQLSVAAVGGLLMYGGKILLWPITHWPFRRSKKSEPPAPANPSDQSNQAPLQIGFNPAFVEQANTLQGKYEELQKQYEELRAQLTSPANHNQANISDEDRQTLVATLVDQRWNQWFEEKKQYLDYLEGIFVGLLEGGTLPENLRNEDAIKSIMTLLGEEVKQQLNTQQEFIAKFLEEHKKNIDGTVKKEMGHWNTQNRTAREATQEALRAFTNQLQLLENFKRSAEPILKRAAIDQSNAQELTEYANLQIDA